MGRAAVSCGVLALAVGSLAVAVRLSSASWNVTALPRVATHSGLGRLAREIDPGFRTFDRGAYDGQFYWGIAIDPLAGGAAHRLFDKASYRYGHPLYGWSGWLLAGGVPAATPAVLLCVGLLSLVAAAGVAVALAGGSPRPWVAGLAVALNPGLLFAVVADLGEPLAALGLLVALAALSTRRLRLEWLALAVLPLAKEELVVVLAAAVAYRLAERRPREAAVLASAVLPAVAWWSFARIRLGAWFTSGTTALGLPFAGWRAAFHHPAASVALALLLGLFAVAAVRAARRRTLVDLVYLGLAAVAVCLAPNATHSFTTALRNTAFLTVLLPFVLGPGATAAPSGESARRGPGRGRPAPRAARP